MISWTFQKQFINFKSFLSKDAPYYGDENGYGTTTLQLANGQMPPPIDTTDYFNGQQQPTYQQQLAFENETSYNNSQSGNPRVVREIIV